MKILLGALKHISIVCGLSLWAGFLNITKNSHIALDFEYLMCYITNRTVRW